MAATFSKPTKVPRWADNAWPLNIVEPSPAKKDAGWQFNEKPRHSFFNWFQHLTGEWTKWIDERLADGTNKNELVLKSPNDGTDALTIRSNGDIARSGIFEDDIVFKAAGVGMRYSEATFSVGSEEDGMLRLQRAFPRRWEFILDGTEHMHVSGDGVSVANGLVVGTLSTTPTEGAAAISRGLSVGHTTSPGDDEITIGDPGFKIDRRSDQEAVLQFDAGDLLHYQRTNNELDIAMDNTTRARFSTEGLRISGGLAIGGLRQPIDNAMTIGDDTFGLFRFPSPELRMKGTTDRISYLPTEKTMEFRVDDRDAFRIGSARVQIPTSGLEVTGGLAVGGLRPPIDDAVTVGDDAVGLFNQFRPQLRMDGSTGGISYYTYHSGKKRMKVFAGEPTAVITIGSAAHHDSVLKIYPRGPSRGKAISIAGAGHLRPTRAQIGLGGYNDFPTGGSGDVFNMRRYSQPDVLYYHNGNAWVPAA